MTEALPNEGAAFYCEEAPGQGGLQQRMCEEGRLWWLNEATGYGLISPADEGRDLFMCPWDVADGETRPLREGDEVRYVVKQNRGGKRPTNVSRRLRYSSWRYDDGLERLEGKEARREYYARLSGGEGAED